MTLYKPQKWPLVILSILALLWIIPVFGVILMAFRPEKEIISGWWRLSPFTFTLNAWKEVWTKFDLLPAIFSSMFISAISTFFCVVLTASAAFAYKYLNFYGKKLTLLLYIVSYVMPQQVMLIPLLVLYRKIGLVNTFSSVLIPFIGGSFAWSIYMMIGYLDSFPKELIEAANIDGSKNIMTFSKIFLPNVGTPLSAVAILQFMWTWNSLLLPMMFMRKNIPLTVLLSRIQGSTEPNWDLLAVATIITTIIPLLFFIYNQKYFVSGSMTGSGVKE